MERVSRCLRGLGYEKLTSMQKQAAASIVRRQNTIIVSPTGTGKTEAAVFPIMYYISARKVPPIGAFYITPLRALNRDIADRLTRIGKCFGVKVMLRHGDTRRAARRRLIEKPPHLIVTTPESFHYIIVNEALEESLSNIEFIVIDELREIISSKRGLELIASLHILEKRLGKHITKIGLTATLSDYDYAKKLLGRGEHVEIINNKESRGLDILITTPRAGENYDNELFEEDPDTYARIRYILNTISRYGKTLVFTNTRNQAERLGYLLSKYSQQLDLPIKVAVHHGSLSREHRLLVEKGFKYGKIDCLVATSSMELGIDIGNINYVIQYMSPKQATRLLQRIGRSRHKLSKVPRGSIVTLPNLFDIIEAIALAKRALAGDLEEEDKYSAPLDVLAHLIAEQLLIEKEIDTHALYNLIKISPVFNNLDFKTYYMLLEYMDYMRIIKIQEDKIKRGYRLKKYFYNTTMITDTRNILVIDISSDKKIGVLSEEFVVLNTEPGDVIVLAGEPWRIIEYDDEEAKIYVEHASESEQVIPRWEGDSIPVERKTADAAVELLSKIKKVIANGEPVGDKIYGGINISDNTIGYIKDFIIKESNNTVINKDKVLVEVNSTLRIIALYYPWGSKAAALLREIVGGIIRSTIGITRITTYSSPYFIIIQYQGATPLVSDANTIIDMLKQLGRSGNLGSTLARVIRSTTAFYWRVYHVAQRFGAIEPSKNRVNKRILEELSNTIIGDEAYKETLVKDFDIETVSAFLRELALEKIGHRIIKTTQPSRLLEDALSKTPLYTPSSHINLNLYMKRILNREITLICLMCGYRWKKRVADIVDYKEIKCPRCGRRYIAAIKGNGDKEAQVIEKFLKKKKLTSEEKKILKELRLRATILAEYGGKGALVLAAPGVGPAAAVNVINSIYRGTDIAKTLYDAEKRYLRIKRFLDKR